MEYVMRSFLLITSCFILLSNITLYYSGAPSSRFDIALEYDTDDDHDSDATEKMTNKHDDEADAAIS